MRSENNLILKKTEHWVFCVDGNPEVFHIIKTGFEDQYFFVQENAFQDQDHGKLEILTKKELKDKYSIELS